MKTLQITPGEYESIGLEVTLKALDSIETDKIRFLIWSQEDYFNKFSGLLSKPINKITSVEEAPNSPGIYLVDSKLNPAEWFEQAVQTAKEHPAYSVVTGPLEKKSFGDPNILGHTDYLKSQFPESNIYMSFFGSIYNVLLLTDHIPLKEVPNQVTLDSLLNGISLAKKYNQVLKDNRPIGLLGLNPHSGEDGLLGTEENLVHRTILNDHPEIVGPLPADGFFNIDFYKKYSFILANYHDQGLIPFKLVHGFKGAQVSLGLPFIRTSVDHGTGKNLFNRNMADPESMIFAIETAKELSLEI